MMNYYYPTICSPNVLPDDYVFTATIKVKDKIDLKHLAEDFEIDLGSHETFEPSFTKGFIPRSNGEHTLTLPEAKFYDFAIAYDAMNDVGILSPSCSSRREAFGHCRQSVQDEISGTRPINNLPSSPWWQPMALNQKTRATLGSQIDERKIIT